MNYGIFKVIKQSTVYVCNINDSLGVVEKGSCERNHLERPDCFDLRHKTKQRRALKHLFSQASLCTGAEGFHLINIQIESAFSRQAAEVGKMPAARYHSPGS